MKRSVSLNALFALLLMTSYSCSSLNRSQEVELKEWQAKNLEVDEKNPTTAAILNVLPGIGDFYNGNPGYGVANLLTWPLSILWAPVGGASGAREVNYYMTKANVDQFENKKKQIKNDIELAMYTNKISKDDYLYGIKKLETMHLTEFKKDLEMKDIIPQGILLENERIPTSAKTK